ncbi:MAG TPA: hypothetical protein PKM50_03050, partial [Methanoregula sp.]|nr:hypothetical protein [Methanoregula sp.]
LPAMYFEPAVTGLTAMKAKMIDTRHKNCIALVQRSEKPSVVFVATIMTGDTHPRISLIEIL